LGLKEEVTEILTCQRIAKRIRLSLRKEAGCFNQCQGEGQRLGVKHNELYGGEQKGWGVIDQVREAERRIEPSGQVGQMRFDALQSGRVR
jgi:hypothetical protein